MPIPKVIHYCWFGGNEKDALSLKCINSWRLFCPDYEIIEWNESNYDIEKNTYMSQAYSAKRWGFVSDYARLDIVYEYGGFYFDTDVELIRSLDTLLNEAGFIGFEQNDSKNAAWKINTGQGFGAEKNDPVIKFLRAEYDAICFIDDNEKVNLTTCPEYNSAALKKLGVKMDNSMQIVGKIRVFPADYFCPMNWKTKQCTVTENTYSIHHFNGSWVSADEKRKRKIMRKIDPIIHLPNRIGKTVLGEKKYNCLKNRLRK